MKIKKFVFGEYQTNCYIIEINKQEFIIDPGIGATKVILKEVKNPIAILNTHGHFDHIWSNKELKEKLKVEVFAPQDDEIFFKNDIFGLNQPILDSFYKVRPNEEIDFNGIKIKFLHFPGHTPGTSVIEINGIWFSGDFIFKNSIGRVDLPFGDSKKMKESLKKVIKIQNNYKIYPGHGIETTLFEEKSVLEWYSNNL